MARPEPDVRMKRLGSRDAGRVLTSAAVDASHAGEAMLVLVRDLSATGIRIETRLAVLKPGDWLSLSLPYVGEQAVQVMWAERELAGCAFASPLEPAHARIVAQALQPSE